MKLFFLSLFLTSPFLTLKSQVTQGNWLLSGSASISSLKTSSTASLQYKQTNLQISPIIGYFLEDKFAIGLKPSLTYGSASLASTNTNTIIGIGPFLRYYFLQPENIFNLFSEVNYSYGSISSKGQPSSKSNTFSFSGGPVLYFNSSVGLEFILSYSTSTIIGYTGTNNEIRFGIGFQFHLEN